MEWFPFFFFLFFLSSAVGCQIKCCPVILETLSSNRKSRSVLGYCPVVHLALPSHWRDGGNSMTTSRPHFLGKNCLPILPHIRGHINGGSHVFNEKQTGGQSYNASILFASCLYYGQYREMSHHYYVAYHDSSA